MKANISNKSRIARSNQAAISLIEVLIVVLVIGILAAGIKFVWADIGGSSSRSKLQSHVKMLNGAVSVYVASGGDLSGVASIDDALAKLKSVADRDSARRFNGYRGATVDPRLRAVMQTSAEASDGGLRAVWDPARKRFALARSGAAGAKWFELGDSGGEVRSEARVGVVKLASQSGGWIWDYEEFGRGEQGIGERPTGGTPEEEEPDGATPPAVLALNPPVFSVPGGTYEYSNFDLPLTFEDTNPAGVSEVFYSIDGGGWSIYSGGTVTVPAGASVSAYSVSIDPDHWIDSVPVTEAYESTFVITGSTSGLFSNPVGGPDMVTGGWGNYFTWGTPHRRGGFTDPSWILYEGASFYDVMPGERFLLGSIEYYNGTITGGTGASGLDLTISLNFAGNTQEERFDYDLNLINSPNSEGNTRAQSADYVQFGQVAAEIPAVIGGVEYSLVLEFGETTENGFSRIDEFFVYEGETATGQLYGTLVRAWGGQG